MDVTQEFAAAVERHQAGDLSAAEQHYRNLLSHTPQHPAALCNLGVLLAVQNKFAESAQCYSNCLAIAPGYPDAHYNFGNLYRRVGQWPEAVGEYRACLANQPDHTGACFNLGLALSNLGDLAAAGDCFRRVISNEPQYADAYNRLGDNLLRSGRADSAVEAFRKYVELKPNDARGLNNLALALANLSQPDEASVLLQKALAIKPDYPDAYNTLGLVLEQQGAKDEAADCYLKAVDLKPDYADAWSNLGTNLTEAGRADEAIAALRKSLAARPNASQIHSNLLLTLNYTSHLTPLQVSEEHRQWAAKFVPDKAEYAPKDRSPDRKLRIGYISADFRSHTVSGFIEHLLTHHDRSQFHVTAYANMPRSDETTDRFRKLADGFRNFIALTDHAALEVIRNDEIDILIDLSGHTAGNRLELLGLKPAPLVMTLFGYPNTTGMTAVDYRITDEVADPPGMTETLYEEKLLRVHGLAWAYRPPVDTPDVAPLPALGNPSLTFGCLNNPAKISDLCLETWARLLAAIPHSRLVLLAGQSHRGAERLTDRFKAVGVARNRLEFVFRLPTADYFKTHNSIDMMLDPFPYNGGVTTCDALWMGVPVLTIAGNSYLSRQGASIMTHVGLSEFIADNPDHLIEVGKTWAANKEWLADIRQGLRQQMIRSPIADGKRYVQALEATLRLAWLRCI